MLLEGLHLPLTTPFYPDGHVYLRKLEHNTDRYSKTPVAGLVVLSSTGEPTLLSEDETRQVLRTAAEAAAPEKLLIAGGSRDSVAGTLELAEFAAQVGFDVALVRGPSVLRGEQRKELVTYFQMIADRAALPIALYGEFSAELVGELAGHKNIVGLFDEGAVAGIAALKAATAEVRREVTVTTIFTAATGRMLKQRGPVGPGTFVSAETLSGGGAALAVAAPVASLKTRVKTVGFQIVAARTSGMLDALLGGAVGVMPAFAASAPQACYEVYAAWKDGDTPLALEKQDRLTAAVAVVEGGLGVPGIKFASDLNGYFGGRPRLPFLPMSGPERETLEGVMGGLRN